MTGAERPLQKVAIVGAGFAGTMTAVHLLRAADTPLEVLLINSGERFGPGVAYGTADPQHLLNVPAELMSAFCEQPLHFSAWASRKTGRSAPAEFLPRRLYGEYLESVLADAERQAPPRRRLVRIEGEAVDAAPLDDLLQVELAGGSTLAVDRLVLATGPVAGQLPFAVPADERVVVDPWSVPGGLHAEEGERVLVVGMGLSAVDSILSLARSAPGVDLVAVSRGGSFPHRHLSGLRFPAPAPAVPAVETDLADLEGLVRGHLEAQVDDGYDWRDAFDGLRPITALLWSRLGTDDRRRFVRGPMREWERRRHRMPPSVAAHLDALVTAGRLSTRAASVVAIEGGGLRLQVRLAAGDPERDETIEFDRVVICTGAGMDIRSCGNPLIERLLERGAVLPDDLGVGLRSTKGGVLLDAGKGFPPERILGIGSIRRGELWETTAVGEIRVQARDLALEIARPQASSEVRSGWSVGGVEAG